MTAEYKQLLSKIHEVRRRFRCIVLARGLAFSLALSLVILVLAVLWVDHWNYSDRSLSIARVISILLTLTTFLWFLGRPLLKKIQDVQIARYVEEHNAALQDRLVTAIEIGKESEQNPIVPLLVRDALGHSQSIQTRSLFDPREPYLSGAVALALIVFFVLVQLFGPDFFPYATLKLYSSWLIPQTESLYRLEVSPGNIQVRKGSDQLISARLIGFDSPEVSLFSLYQGKDRWERNRMEPAKGSNAFGFLFLDIHEKVRYYVQSGNVKSSEFGISVTDVVQVERINLSYHFPRYTALPIKREEDGGEITALKGTQVDVEAVTNVDAVAARILLEDGTSVPMQKNAERKFQGRIEVRKDSTYQIELTDSANTAAIGSHKYPITALDDQPPTIVFLKPGRDKRATKLEEVLTEVKADDDFGVNSLKLHFTVNGGQENVVDLFRQEIGTTPKSISGAHTFFLEEYNLEPGDFISYFAKASDSHATTTSDIYFLEVRPFGKEFSQAQAASGMGNASDIGAVLSARQKEILAATWRLIRDNKSFNRKEYSDNVKVVAESQLKLQQQTQTLSERIQRRALATRDKEFQKLSENLVKAVEAMLPAQKRLSEEKPREAISPEQTSLQYLMRAEAYFKEIQVAYGNPSSAQNNSLGAEELEGLFELELDKLKNQYETLQQRNSMQASEEIDELNRKLKELARRQQQINERQHAFPASRFSQGGSSGNSEQQALQTEIEKLARQLERLSRETQNEDLLKASQRLKQAAQEMSNTSRAGGTESQNRGLQALSRMNDAQQLLDNQQKNSFSDELKRIQANAEQLKQQQEKIQSQLDQLARSSSGGATPDPSAKAGEQGEKDFHKKRQIFQDKSQLKKGLNDMEQSLFSSAKRSAVNQKSASQKLQSAGNSIRDNRIQEKVDQASQLIAGGLLDGAKQREQDIQAAIEALQQKIASAEKSPVNSGTPPTREEKLSRALSQTGDLIGSLESLNRRLQQLQGSRSQPGGKRPNQSPAGESKKSPEPGEQSSDLQAGNPGRPATAGSQDTTGQGRAPSNSNQADGNSSGSALGGTSPEGRRQQASGDDTEHQYYGSTNFGNAAVNFGDRELPPPASLTPEQRRQFEKEYELRVKEAQEIGKHLADQPDLAGQVRNVVERMKQMNSLKFLQDNKELERLRSSVIEGFRQLEVDLSKNLQQQFTRENLHLAKDEDIPEPYRKQVEDYYKALSKK
jgi:hypothetical protein